MNVSRWEGWPLEDARDPCDLEEVDCVRRPDTELHLLGVTRTDKLATFQRYGVTSFDSTSPFRQAFKDDRDNYHTDDRTWIALRVPQVDANPKLQRRIRSGEIDGQVARRLEQRALGAATWIRSRHRHRSRMPSRCFARVRALYDEHRDRSATVPRGPRCCAMAVVRLWCVCGEWDRGWDLPRYREEQAPRVS